MLWCIYTDVLQFLILILERMCRLASSVAIVVVYFSSVKRTTRVSCVGKERG